MEYIRANVEHTIYTGKRRGGKKSTYFVPTVEAEEKRN